MRMDHCLLILFCDDKFVKIHVYPTVAIVKVHWCGSYIMKPNKKCNNLKFITWPSNVILCYSVSECEI